MLRKDVKEIKETINELSSSIVEKAKKYDEITELLDEISFGLDKCITKFDEKSMSYIVKISYKIPDITLYIDDEGDAVLNSRFRAINMLNLISVDAMNEIANAIRKANSLNKGEDEKL